MRRAWLWTAILAAASFAVSLGLTLWLGQPFFLGLLFLPFVFRFGPKADSTVPKCPQCGWRGADPAYEFCPRDGTRLSIPPGAPETGSKQA